MPYYSQSDQAKPHQLWASSVTLLRKGVAVTQTPTWPNGQTLAVSVVVNVEEGAEYNIADGDKVAEAVDEAGIALRAPMRNLANESNYRYGIQAGAPRVLELFRQNDIRATFTAAAVALERSPEVAAGILKGQHEVCAHGYRWVQQHGFDEERERKFIRDAAASIEATCGKRPAGWLSRYLVSENTRRLLAEEGFTYHMDDYSDDSPFWDWVDDRPILVVPYAPDTNDMKMWSAPALTPRDWLDYNIDTFEVLYRESENTHRMMSIGLHLRVIGRPARFLALEKLIHHVRSKPRSEFLTRQEIADRWTEKYPPDR